MVGAAVIAVPMAAHGQGSDPGLVVPVPPMAAVETRVDSFTTASGQRAAYTIVRSPAEALVSFDRAKALGQGGARDIGLPAARAALRLGAEARAVEWINWALASFANIRQEIAADRELATLLQHPDVRRP